MERINTVTYGLDLQNVYNIGGANLSISPFIGVIGITQWKKKEKVGEVILKNHTETSVLGDVGVSVRWFAGRSVFLNTQAKYLTDLSENRFVLSLGLGYLLR